MNNLRIAGLHEFVAKGKREMGSGRTSGLKKVALLVSCMAMAIALPAQTLTTLASFDGSNGAYPYYESLVPGPSGLYGTTLSGGANGLGTAFVITPNGALTTLYSFCSQTNCADGVQPYGGLVLSNGSLYGTTSNLGANYAGTVFEINPETETLATLYNFCSQTNCTDGGYPQAGLVQGKDGNFYGTTTNGGSSGYGTVFKITPAGQLTTLYSFCSEAGCADGYFVQSSLMQASNGNFYATTQAGGANGWGTVFEITPKGKLTTLHSFEYTDGATPVGGLVEVGGNFYGTTAGGGKTDNGTVFKMTMTGTLATIYNFCSVEYCTDGDGPNATLIKGSNGNLFGTTWGGGAYYVGTVFEITTKGKLTTLHSFERTDGAWLSGGLIEENGLLYGTTTYGGAYKEGTVFSLTLP